MHIGCPVKGEVSKGRRKVTNFSFTYWKPIKAKEKKKYNHVEAKKEIFLRTLISINTKWLSLWRKQSSSPQLSLISIYLIYLKHNDDHLWWNRGRRLVSARENIENETIYDNECSAGLKKEKKENNTKRMYNVNAKNGLFNLLRYIWFEDCLVTRYNNTNCCIKILKAIEKY